MMRPHGSRTSTLRSRLVLRTQVQQLRSYTALHEIFGPIPGRMPIAFLRMFVEELHLSLEERCFASPEAAYMAMNDSFPLIQNLFMMIIRTDYLPTFGLRLIQFSGTSFYYVLHIDGNLNHGIGPPIIEYEDGSRSFYNDNPNEGNRSNGNEESQVSILPPD